jgi:hypothetical protein
MFHSDINSSSNPDNQQSAQYLSVPTTSFTSSPATSSASSASSASSTSHRFHPVVEAQTEYFNRTYVQAADNQSSGTTTTMSNYSSPSEYAYSHYTGPRQIVSITEINQMRQTLRHRRVNTLTELHRIERVLTSLPGFMSDYMDEMTDAWGYYVSTNFLQELRGLTRQYPFSTELVEDAKARVYSDPKSSRSWNLAWLLLAKMKTE